MSNRYAVIDGHLQPRLRYLDQIAPLSLERREELRAKAILANDLVRLRAQHHTETQTVAYFQSHYDHRSHRIDRVLAYHDTSREALALDSNRVSEWVSRLSVVVERTA